MRCSICGRAFDPAETVAMPFCSDRCRAIDLGRWFDERYCITRLRDEAADEAQENELALE